MSASAATTGLADLPEGWVLPRYDGGGIANIGPTILRHFGVAAAGAPLAETALAPTLLRGARTVVLLVVDALGYDQLMERMAEGACPRLVGLLERGGGTLTALTSIFPSTTAGALMTLHTAVSPAQHGSLAYTLYLPSLGRVVNMITFEMLGEGGAATIEPTSLAPVPTIHRQLSAVGVACHTLSPSNLVNSPLSRVLHDGATAHGFTTAADMSVQIRRLVEASQGPTFVLAYWPAVDTIAHRYGPRSAEHGAEVAALDFILDRELWHRLGPDTLLLVTADHGQMTTSRERAIALHEHAELLAHLAQPPAGERRVVYLHVAPERRDWVREYVSQTFGAAARILTREEAFTAGLFGPPPFWPEAERRVGDLILLARDDWQLPYLHDPARRAQQWERLAIGAHAGLTSAEMRVPLLAVRT
jgi:hypothetical protein